MPVELIDLVNCVIIFFISNDLTHMINFPYRVPHYDPDSPALLDLFLSSDPSICSTMTFFPLGNFDHVLVSVSSDFPKNSKQDTPFHRFTAKLMTILVLIGMVFVII